MSEEMAKELPEIDNDSLEGRFLRMVLQEMQRQVEKWGVQTHNPLEWACILGEEVGEVNRAVGENYWRHADIQDYVTEMIQVAAVAVSALKALHLNTERAKLLSARVTPDEYGQGFSPPPQVAAMMLLNKASSRLMNAAVEAVQLVVTNHPTVSIAEPMPLSPTRLSFSAMKGEQPLHGQEDFAEALRTCKSDTDLILAIAKRIEAQMELPPVLRRAGASASR